MALDKLVDSNQLDGALSFTADAIREKTGEAAPITWDMDTGFAQAIEGISGGIDTSDADATSSDILDGKTAYVNGEKVEGNIPTKTGSNLSASGKTVTVPAGYYAQQYTKDVATGSASTPATTVTANPSISVNSSGLITATTSATKSVTPTVSSGYVSSGTAGTITVSGSNTSQLFIQSGKTVTPTESEQTAVTSGKYTTGAVKVGAISSTYVGSAIAQNDSDDLTVSGATVTAPAGYYAEDATKTIANGTVVASVSSNTDGSASMSASGISPLSSGTSNYYITLSTTPGSVKAKATGGTAGYVTSSTTNETSATSVAVSGNNTKLYIPEATFANSATSGTTYTDKSSTGPVLVAGDYLYINKGYTPDIKISLAKLVPDGSDVKGHGEYIISGHSAYDNDGTLVAGTIPTLVSSDLTVNGKTVTIPLGKYTGESSGTAVSTSIGVGKVTSGTASITSLTRTYNSTNGNFDITGSANVSAPTVNTAGYISSSEGTKSAKTGGATVTATVAKIVGSTAITGTTTKKPSIGKVATPTGVTNAASGDATTTAPSSGVYVAVKSNANTGTLTATPSVTTAGYGDATNHGITANTATVGAQASDTTYIPITTTSASVSGKTVSYGTGWITGGSNSVADGTVVASVSSNTGGSASMAATGFTASTDETDYYVALATSAGSVKAKAVGGTAGYVTSSTTNETSATSVSVSGNGDKLYIPKATYAGSVVSASVNVVPNVAYALSGTVTDIGTETKPSGTDGSDYWTITPSGTITNGQARSRGRATISVAGYVETGYLQSSYKTLTITPSVTEGTARYIPKAVIAGSSTNATATTTVEPGTVSISKQSTPSGVTNAASGNATTTAPSSGVYVAVQATAAANNTGTTSAISGSGTATVTGAGYAPASLTGSVAVSGTATAKTSAKDSSMTYVPITTATPAFDGGTLSGGSTATGTNVTLSTTDNNGMKVQTAYTAASTAVLYNGAVNGWVSQADNAQALAAQSKASTNGTAYYVTAVTMPKDKGFTVTTTADTALDTTSDLDVTNNAYRRVDITNNANGTVLVANSGNSTITSGSATAGNLTVSAYNSSGTAENNKSIVSNGKWVATTVSAAGTFYGRVTVSAGMIENNKSGGTSSGTINMGSQIKIGAGYYPSDLYYTAKDRVFTYDSTNKKLTITY